MWSLLYSIIVLSVPDYISGLSQKKESIICHTKDVCGCLKDQMKGLKGVNVVRLITPRRDALQISFSEASHSVESEPLRSIGDSTQYVSLKPQRKYAPHFSHRVFLRTCSQWVCLFGSWKTHNLLSGGE